MSRPNVTNVTVSGLAFARACVLDQQAASHRLNDHSWDKRYSDALAALDMIVSGHRKSERKKGRQP